MIRASTPTHTFKFKINPVLMAEILVTYVQDGKIILEKHKDDFIGLDEPPVVYHGVNYWYGHYTLTQQETNLFNATEYYQTTRNDVEIQVRVLLEDETVMTTKIKSVPVDRVLDDKILTRPNTEVI